MTTTVESDWCRCNVCRFLFLATPGGGCSQHYDGKACAGTAWPVFRCTGITNRGAACRNIRSKGSRFCRVHQWMDEYAPTPNLGG
jgi:hypothetical protein